jgi:hypothetical protein
MRLILADYDLVPGAGEVAEFDTRVPHWFGSAIGLATYDALHRRGRSVRLVNRSGHARVPDDVEVVGGDARDPAFNRRRHRGRRPAGGMVVEAGKAPTAAGQVAYDLGCVGRPRAASTGS